MDIEKLKILTTIAETFMPDEDPGEGCPTVEQIEDAIAYAKELMRSETAKTAYRTITTESLGIAIRDHMSGAEVHQELYQTEIEFIDETDPNNLVMELVNGQRFKVSITAI